MATVAVPFKRLLKRGMSGLDVVAVKRALKKAGYVKGIVVSPFFGGGLDRQLRTFQQDQGLVVDGQYGPRTHARLVPYFDAYGRWLYSKQPVRKPGDPHRQGVVDYARWGVAHEPAIHYEQVRPYDAEPRKLPKRIDCSAFSKLAYQDAGASTPDGLPWGYGNTTSLQQHGVRVLAPEPGDLVFYRDPDHVGIYVGNGQVIEHGDEGGPRLELEWYRTVTNVVSYLPRADGGGV